MFWYESNGSMSPGCCCLHDRDSIQLVECAIKDIERPGEYIQIQNTAAPKDLDRGHGQRLSSQAHIEDE
jgi:hypothetical protein